ncbi:MAG: RNA chaperone Hfq [Ruminococcaceae bacterium]|nr:RNA chaperone Hfq [Oscillospiraceae bacterium]
MSKVQNLQDLYLNAVRKEKIDVTVFLTNGFQIRGQVKSFDSYTILLESDGKEQLIFKHAVSTVVPRRSVNINND